LLIGNSIVPIWFGGVDRSGLDWCGDLLAWGRVGHRPRWRGGPHADAGSAVVWGV